MKNIAIAAVAKLASPKHVAAEFPRWQYFSWLAPMGMGEPVRYWLAANVKAVFAFLFVLFRGFRGRSVLVFFYVFPWFLWQKSKPFTTKRLAASFNALAANLC